MDTGDRSDDDADFPVPAANQSLPHMVSGVFVIGIDAGKTAAFGKTIGINKGNIPESRQKRNFPAMVSHIYDTLHLLGNQGGQGVLKIAGMLRGIGKIVLVAFEQPHIVHDDLIAVFFAVRFDAIHNFRRIKNRQIFRDDANAVGTAELQVFGKAVGVIVQLLGDGENLLGFAVTGGAGFSVEYIGNRGNGYAGA